QTFPTLYRDIGEKIENIKLPPGYELVWKGEKESSSKAQAALIPGIIPAVVVILFLLVLTFNSFAQVLIILITIPFAAIGITAGLLLFDMPFGFLALLGAMSLSGMMIKNIIILLDAVRDNLEAGMSRYDAVVEAAITRVRPVLLAAGTTILGVVPLLGDVFWQSMAVTIMAGLAFGSLLTLIIVPVLYALLYRVRSS
ncbi:MAG: efflux RND transporter permease subunit, partial [Chlamydiia bacterium]|nr:efflux RND transporter permease subunit [Chlamydiia bacterium]